MGSTFSVFGSRMGPHFHYFRLKNVLKVGGSLPINIAACLALPKRLKISITSGDSPLHGSVISFYLRDLAFTWGIFVLPKGQGTLLHVGRPFLDLLCF